MNPPSRNESILAMLNLAMMHIENRNMNYAIAVIEVALKMCRGDTPTLPKEPSQRDADD